jgi:hypothetical protein
MQLTIDNFDMRGPVGYTQYLDAERLPHVARRLNKPATMQAVLVAVNSGIVVPHQGARIWLKEEDGAVLFAGYVTQEAGCEYAGQTSQGTVARYVLTCASDEWLLDRKALPQRLPFTARPAGSILKQLTADVAPGGFDVSGAQDCDAVPSYSASVQKKWSEHAAGLALRTRAAYRAEDGAVIFAPLGSKTLRVDESDPNCNRQSLRLVGDPCGLNDVTVAGAFEPRTYVKDYFGGDGYTLSFSLAGQPMGTIDHTLFEDEFPGTQLNPVLWQSGVGSTAQVNNGRLVANGNGQVQLTELVELGGGLVLQHGCFEFQGASTGTIGGLYAGGSANANCIAGVLVQPSGSQSVLRAMVNGTATGPSLTTVSGHQYQITTRIFASQSYRESQVFHSSQQPSGAGRGGDSIAADARIVVEIHDVDPGDPATMAAPSTVLYDAVLNNVAGYCNYFVMNGTDLHCDVSFTRMRKNGGAVVRSAIPGQSFRTRLQGSLADGGECRLNLTNLYFLAAYVPEASEQIVVSYRTGATATAEQRNDAAIAGLANGADDGVRSSVVGLIAPEARTTQDCVNAALALLDDGTPTAWRGEYQTWSDFLGAPDVHPGDAVAVNAPSQNAQFTAIAREIEIQVKDPRNDRSVYAIKFANDAAESLSFEVDTAQVRLLPVGISVPGNWTLAAVKDAEFSQILANQVTIITNVAPPQGGGFEVRAADQGWGTANDRNLWGRYMVQSFTVPRLSRSQSYYIRQYDGAQPPNYSRDSILLHVDWPL